MSEPQAIGASLRPAEQRTVLNSDPVTGELRVAGPKVTLAAALVDKKLAIRHGARRAIYLTELGRRVREALSSPPPPSAPAAESFEPATGNEVQPPLGEQDPHVAEQRRREVDEAWQSLLRIRELTGSGASPAPWERLPDRMVRAISLALEESGIPCSAVDRAGRRTRTGYKVTAGPEAGPTQVRWAGPASFCLRQESGRRLEEVAAALSARGWESIAYFGARHIPYLAVTPLG